MSWVFHETQANASLANLRDDEAMLAADEEAAEVWGQRSIRMYWQVAWNHQGLRETSEGCAQFQRTKDELWNRANSNVLSQDHDVLYSSYGFLT